MFFKRIRSEFRELRYSVQKLNEKYIELERRIKILEKEKADCKINQSTDTVTETMTKYDIFTGKKRTVHYKAVEKEQEFIKNVELTYSERMRIMIALEHEQEKANELMKNSCYSRFTQSRANQLKEIDRIIDKLNAD